MPPRKIITVPDEILRKISDPIEKVDTNEKKLVKEMFDTMYHHNGIGLAAIQIGIPKRIIVLDVSKKDEKKNPLCFINPIIKNKSKEKSLYEEGFIIKTSINTNLQKTLDKVLIDGLIKQDKKSGWKGPINNLDKSKNFDTFLKEIKSPFPDNWKIYQTISLLPSDAKNIPIYYPIRNRNINVRSRWRDHIRIPHINPLYNTIYRKYIKHL